MDDGEPTDQDTHTLGKEHTLYTPTNVKLVLNVKHSIFVAKTKVE